MYNKKREDMLLILGGLLSQNIEQKFPTTKGKIRFDFEKIYTSNIYAPKEILSFIIENREILYQDLIDVNVLTVETIYIKHIIK